MRSPSYPPQRHLQVSNFLTAAPAEMFALFVRTAFRFAKHFIPFAYLCEMKERVDSCPASPSSVTICRAESDVSRAFRLIHSREGSGFPQTHFCAPQLMTEQKFRKLTLL